MSNDIKKVRETSPVYLSLPKLEKLIDLASTRTLPTLNASYFRGHGFSESDAFLAISALRFLLLIDEMNQPTEAMKKLRFQAEDKRKQGFEEIVRVAYQKLFSVHETPYTLPSKELSDEMTIQYDLSRRVVPSAVAAFLKLCHYAGLVEQGPAVKTRAPRKTSGTTPPPAKTTKSTSAPAAPNSKHTAPTAPEGYEGMPVADGRFVLSVPSGVKDKLLNDEAEEEWRTVKAALRALADAVAPKKLPNKEPEA